MGGYGNEWAWHASDYAGIRDTDLYHPEPEPERRLLRMRGERHIRLYAKFYYPFIKFDCRIYYLGGYQLGYMVTKLLF